MPKDNNNTLGSILTGAGVAAGGYGSYRSVMRTGGFSQFSAPVVSAFAEDSARKFARQYYKEDPSVLGLSKRWYAKQLRSMASDTNLSAAQVRDSIMRASRIADPTGHLSSYFDQRLALAMTGSEALADAATILEGTSSIYATRATSIFLEDVDIINARAAANLSTEVQSLGTRVRRNFNPVAPTTLDKIMQADLAKIQQLTGADVGITRVARPDVIGSELHLKFSGMKNVAGSFTLRIPEPLAENPNVIVRGTTQQSRYLAGQYGLLEEGMLKESFNHAQWTLRRAAEDLIPDMMTQRRLSQRAARAMVNEFQSKMMEAPEWIPSMNSLSLQSGHAGVDLYTDMRSQIMRLSAPAEGGGIRPLTEFEYADAVLQGVQEGGATRYFYPGYSPAQIAKGVVSIQDVRGGLSLIPEAVPYGRRPLQYMRMGFSPTESAMIAMASNRVDQRFAWAKATVGVDTPIVRAAYVSSALGHKVAGTGVSSEGQLLISGRLGSRRAVNQWRQFDIASNQLQDLADLIDTSKGSSWTIGKDLEKGAMLGYGPDGRPVVLPKKMHIVGATAFAQDAAKGDFIRVIATEEVNKMNWAKVFGGAKGMAASVPQEYIEDVVTRSLGFSSAKGSIYKGIDAVITMDELKKNRGLHYNQMFTALWDFTKQNMQAGLTQGSSFASNPEATIASIRKAAVNAERFDHELVLKELGQLARAGRLTPEQMGGVFGAVPEIYGGLEALGELSPAEIAEINRGTAVGATQLFFEGLGGPGAGRTATIEPRMFELLNAPHFGTLGDQLQQEIAGRMSAAYPQRFAEQRELTRALQSVLNLKGRAGSQSAAEVLRGLSENELLPQKAFNLKIAGIGDVYFPSAGELTQLGSFQTAAGASVSTPLSQAFRDVLETASGYDDKDVTREMMQKKLSNLQRELTGARIGTVTGTQGLLRNRLPGSMFLTAVQPTLDTKLAPGVVGITSKYAEQMFNQMRGLGLYDERQLRIMERQLTEGGKIAGILGRHPYIGPYSTQAVQYQLIPGSDPIAMINERMQHAVAFRGQLNEESVNAFLEHSRRAMRGNKLTHQRAMQMGAEHLGSPIRLSPFVGLAGDVDGDIVAAMFAGPQLQKSLTEHALNTDALAAYEEYAIRSQVLKAKAKGAGNITLRQAMAGDAIKLGVTEGGRLGRLSVGLQQYRAGLLSGAGGISAEERMQALGLLEWMEQTPISSKHIAPGKETQTLFLLDDIQAALDRKSANGIADAARIVLREAKTAGQDALRQGFTIAMEDYNTGDVTTRFIPGIDLEKSSQNIINVRRAFESTADGRESAARIREMIMQRGGWSTGREAALSLMDPALLEKSPFGSFFSRFASQTPGMFSELSARVSSFTNKLGAAGRSMLQHARPLALGTAAGLGLAAFLSDPPRLSAPGSSTAPTPVIKSGGSGGANMGTDIHPDSHVQGEPTAPSPVAANNTARVAANEGSGYRVNIRGNISSQVDHRELIRQLRQAAGGRVNSTLRDQRSSLTPQRLSSIMRDD